MSADLDHLVQQVRASATYREISVGLIRRVGTAELAKRRGLKAAVKATKSKLHQIAGVYVEGAIDYARYVEALEACVATGSAEKLRRTCVEVMTHHASSRERLPVLDPFYATIFESIDSVHRVIDLACGLNPLAIPRMPLAHDCEYWAYDVYEDLIAFLNRALPLLGVRGGARVADLTVEVPGGAFDVALLLKSLPCLERLDRTAGTRLLTSLNARHVVVSFPVHSLGGYAKGMVQSYDAHLRKLVDGQPWTLRRFEFATELAFVVTKPELN